MLKRFVVFFALLCALRVAQAQEVPRADAAHPEISAAGRGEIQIAPTRAAVSVTIVTHAGSAAQAASDNASRVSTTRAALIGAGVSQSDIRTTSYNVTVDYDRKGQPSGFLANYSMRVETSELDKIGQVVDAALAGGANVVSSVLFFTPNSAAQRREAMVAAVRAAREDADAIARAAGGSLGRLISMSAASGGMPGMYAEVQLTSSVSIRGAPTYIPPGDLTITAQASGRWEFVPGTAH